MPMDMADEEENASNETIFPPCPINSSCSDLPGHCIDCNFDYSCVYGENVTDLTCVPKDTVECEVASC